MDNLIDLNIFSNSSRPNPEDTFVLLSRTLHSWCNAFGYSKINTIRIFVDDHPFIDSYPDYIKLLQGLMNQYDKPYSIIKTTGFSDGYVQSTNVSETDYIFQLEHDWRFNNELITHSLEEIIEGMKSGSVEHLRFNKRPNEDRPRAKEVLKPEVFNNVPICVTKQYRSNNPHIINRESYVSHWNNYINLKPVHPPSNPRSGGVEQRLWKVGGAIYGPLGLPPTIEHLEGRIR